MSCGIAGKGVTSLPWEVPDVVELPADEVILTSLSGAWGELWASSMWNLRTIMSVEA